jgi:hypothetical protein
MPRDERYLFQVLTDGHAIGSFECEYEEFGDYLRDAALKDMEAGLARTFVEVDQNAPAAHNVAGFFTLRAHAAKIDAAFIDTFDGEGDIEVPLIELMYLARDAAWRGVGMGDGLMIDVINVVAQASDLIGFVGLHLRSTPEGRRLYEDYDFVPFTAHPVYDGARYILPLADIRTIAASLREV